MMKEEEDSGRSLLKDLLQSSRNLPKRSSELGNIQLNLSEIRRQTNELRKDNHQHHPSDQQQQQQQQYTKAHYLLAPSGITIEDIENDLDGIDVHVAENYHHVSAAAATSNLESSVMPATSTAGDFDIKVKKDENILMAIEQSLSSAAQDFDNFINSNISMDWKARKNELRQSFQIMIANSGATGTSTTGTGQNTIGVINDKYNKGPMGKATTAKTGGITWKSADKAKNSIFNRGEFTDVKAPTIPQEILSPTVSYALRQRFETHAEIVYNLNESRQAGKDYPIALVFNELTKLSNNNNNGNNKSKQIHETWKIINSMCKNAGEKKFYTAYNAKDDMNFESINLRKKIVSHSKAFLEAQFLEYINENYRTQIKKTSTNNNTTTLQPTNVEKISFFLENKLKQNDEWKLKNLVIINGIPLWATIFHMLRAGLYEDALQFTMSNRENFQKLERNFPAYLKSFVTSSGNKISQDLNDRLHAEFNQYFKHLNKENDPFRYAVYKIIGRCDLTRKNLPHITSSIEDWLWVHLCFTREDGNFDDDPIYERYTLLDLQNSVIELGAEKFNGSSNNSLYLQVLTFVGLYELAIQYCYSMNEVDAVHLAIGLAYYGLIRPTTEIVDSLCHKHDNRFFLNFSAMMISYIRSFKISDPKVACEYLILICLTNKDICHESLRKLVLETREFTMLLGSIDKDGIRIPGLIENRKKLLQLTQEEEFFQKITKQAAIRADEENRYQESILLYQLSKEYDTVIAIVNKLLGELIYNTELDKQFQMDGDDEIINVAKNLNSIYDVNAEIASKISTKNKETCQTLLKFIDLRNQFVLKNWYQVLKLAEEIKMIPIFQHETGQGQLQVAQMQQQQQQQQQHAATSSATTAMMTNLKSISQDFIKLDNSIIRNVPSLLIVIMTSLIQILKSLQKSSFQHANDAKIAQLTQISKNCMIFAGLIEYKMPKDIYKTLISLESML